MNQRIHRFTAMFDGSTPAGEVFPIVRLSEGVDHVIGGFVLDDGPTWKCFIAATGYPESLFFDSIPSFWITPDRDDSGDITQLVLSSRRQSDESWAGYIGDDSEA